MASLCSSDLNCGLLLLPLSIYSCITSCTAYLIGNVVKKDAMCYTPSVHTPQSGQGVVSHATPARCFCSLKSVIVV